MPRPRSCRRISFEPNTTYFKPAGIPKRQLEQVTLTLEEFESVRLNDLEEMDQKEAAEKMNVSQPTFHRMVLQARKKISDALVNGKAIRIEGGNYQVVRRGINKRSIMRKGRGLKRRRGSVLED